MSDKIQPSHLHRRAVVYLRQSSLHQVHKHPESTARQYSLRQRAVDLGWAEDQIDLIDEDLGQSGASAAWRPGFKRLAEDVAHGRIGAILALEVSRLARSSADWYRLLDLCGLADVVLIDEYSVYTPRSPDDRLLLGLKGTMSEVEQTWMRLRLQGGKLSKARRGKLHFNAPIGYMWDEIHESFRLDPDEHVQRAVRLIFERFRLEGSAYAVVRYFMRHGLQMPGLDHATREMRWEAPRYGIVIRMLHNPAYSGAYVYGRHERRVALNDAQERRSRLLLRSQDARPVCLHDQHPAYISWEEFMANQRKLHDNSASRNPGQCGAVRQGQALLQGIVLCGKCGHKMNASYVGRLGRARYDCRATRTYGGKSSCCWAIAAPRIDEAVTKLFFNTVQTPEIELGLAVVREAERQAAEVDHQWKLRLDRARYEARLAERRYKAVDPDHRVVARTLEQEWNEKLRDLDALEQGRSEARSKNRLELTEADRSRILALAKDLPRVWNAQTTTQAERKHLLRMLVQQVTLSPIDIPQRVTRIQVLWRTGAVTDFTIPRPRSASRGTTDKVVELIRDLAGQGRTDMEIAVEMNRQGFRNIRGKPWSDRAVRSVRRHHGLQKSRPPASQVHQPNEPDQRPDGLYSIHGVALRLGVPEASVRYWLKKGWIQPTEGGGHGCTAWFRLDPPFVRRLQALKASHKPKHPRLVQTTRTEEKHYET